MLILLEKAFAVIAILFYSDAIISLFRREGVPIGAIARLLFYCIPLINLVLLGVHWKKVLPIVFREKLWWVLVGFAVISIFWSAAPGITLKQILALFRFSILGIYLGTNYSLKEQIQLFTWSFGIAAVLSFGFGLGLPQYGVMGMGSTLDPENIRHAGSWRGIFTHKNFLGRIMSFAAIVFLLSAIGSRLKLYQVGWPGLALSLLLLLLSTSKTSLVITIALLILVPFFKALRWNYSSVLPFSILMIIVTSIATTFFLENAEPILGALGKDLTLTGRTELWDSVMASIRDRPWLGHGYGGFWLGEAGASEIIWYELKWSVPHAHNGFLDLTLDLGYIGLFLFIASFGVTVFKAIRWVRLTQGVEGLFPLVYLTYVLMFNFTESSFFRQGFIVIIYTSTVLSLHNRSRNLILPSRDWFAGKALNKQTLQQSKIRG